MTTREYGPDWIAEQNDPLRVRDGKARPHPEYTARATDSRGLRVEMDGEFFRWPLPLKARQVDRLDRGLVSIADDQGATP